MKSLFAVLLLSLSISSAALAWGPGWCAPPAPGPFYPPAYPGWAVPAPGYVFTCFSQNNFGQWFYATGFNPNFTQAQAFQYCAMSGGYCVATGCR
jgi:hypothetical protein